MWHYRDGDDQVGPVSEEEIGELADQNQIDQDTQVWSSGMESWQPLRTTELNTLFPYTAPQAQTANSSGFTFTPLKGLSKVLRIALWLHMADGIFNILVSIAMIYIPIDQLDEQAFIDDPSLIAISLAIAAVGLFSVILYLATVIIWCMWIKRAARNVRTFGAEGLEFTPGWCVGWYFVPFANLIMPFRAMKEIYAASVSPKRWKMLPAPGPFTVWWTLWIVINMASNISFRASMANDFASNPAVDILLAGGGMLLALAALKVVAMIQEVQEVYDS